MMTRGVPPDSRLTDAQRTLRDDKRLYTFYPSAIGDLLLVGDGDTLSGLYFPNGSKAMTPQPSWERDDDAFPEVKRQLAAYFSGWLTEFDLPLAPQGSPFQLRVWDLLRTIPYGHTSTYGTLAKRLGDAKLSRAVGLANGSNPIPIIIPCHRVIGADGSLTGYGGGMERKQWLLAREGLALPLG